MAPGNNYLIFKTQIVNLPFKLGSPSQITFALKKMQKYFYTILFVFLSINGYAASIKGSVVDSKNDPLTGVVISVTGAGKGAVTDFDGKYEITGLANGVYEIVFTYATYKTYKESVTLNGADLTFDMKMLPESTELAGTVVKAIRITNTENSVISEIRNSNTIVSGTSAAQISKTLDRNAADVVKRIPGVTIQDDRFIVIRGLPDRYNTVWLNDASTPSSEADKKAFSFDIIPAGLIDRLLIYKAPSPELPGDFAGGMVKVYSTCMTDKNQFMVSAQTSSREFSTGTVFNYNKPSKTEWLGYDDGSKNIPKGIPGFISTKDPNYKTSIASWSKSFGNDWVVNTKQTSPDMRLSLAYSRIFNFNKVKIANTGGVVYSSILKNTRIHRQDWDSASQEYNYIDQNSVTATTAGFMENVGISVGNSKIEFRNLYNQTGTSSLTIRNTVKDTGLATNADERSYAMGYDSKATYASELSGMHKNKTDTRKYSWTLGYTDLFKNTPDLRRIKYSKQQTEPDTLFRAQVSNNIDILNGGGRYYATLYEHTYSFNQQITQTIKIKDYAFDLSAGTYMEYKARSYKIRELGYVLKPGSGSLALSRLPINQIFADSNVDGSSKFKIAEGTNSYDHYDGQNELIAGFLSFKAPIGKSIVLCGGARYEYNMQSLRANIGVDTVNMDVKTKFLLPSLNATYNISDKALFRLAYGKTVNRPEFREYAPIFYYDFDELSGNYGSLYPNQFSTHSGRGDTLKVAEINNFDARYELYPGPGEMIQVGVFYKTFANPITRVKETATGDKAYSYLNGDKAYCAGFELDLKKNLSFLDSALGTKVFRDFSLVGNLTIIKSELTLDTTRIHDGIPKSAMQGQSPYIVNFGAYYQNKENGFQGSLLYNVYGPRMYALGASIAGGESVGELPFQSLDFTLSKMFRKFLVVTVGVQNILGSRVVFVNDVNRDNKFDTKHDLEVKTYNPGRYYSIGLKVKL